MKKDVIICISREFGSGGRQLAMELSEKLGIPMYDKELIARVAKESDMTENFVKEHQERGSGQHFFGIPWGHSVKQQDYDGIMTPEKLFRIQSQVIREIAEEQKSCIFVGRCADVILQKDPRSFAFFIHSPTKKRVARIVETENVSEKEATKMVKKTDQERRSYHDYYTGIKWGHPTNYDMILNMGRMDMEKAKQVICDYIES